MRNHRLIIALALALTLCGWAAQAATLSVPSQYGTIQAAVNAATAGDTIAVSAGSYAETGQILINKDLAIIGAGAAVTTITKTENTGDSNSGDARGWIRVTDGVSLKLSGITMDGAGVLINIGILSRGSVDIRNCSLKNMVWDKYTGRGVCIYKGTNNVVKDVTLSNIGRIGIFVFDQDGTGGTDATVANCTYIGKGDGDWLDYGVEFGGGGTGRVVSCRISGCVGVAASDGSTSAGILATTYYGNGTAAAVTDCTITGCTAAIAVGYIEGDNTQLVARNNNFGGNEYAIVTTGPAVDAQSNWWGVVTPSDIKGLIYGRVDYAAYRMLPCPILYTLRDSEAAYAKAVTSVANSATGCGSWRATSAAGELYFYTSASPLFGRQITVSDLLVFSYSTNKAGAQTQVDWFLKFYTEPYPGGDAGWYGNRLNAEPMYSYSLGAPANQWNVWSTAAGSNQLTFFDNPHTPMGFYGGPTLDNITAGPINWGDYLSGNTYSANYSAMGLKLAAIGTGSAWTAQLNGYVDAVTMSLKSGDSAIFDLESSTPADALFLSVSPANLYVQPGGYVNVWLSMSDLNAPAVGYQALLSYNTDMLQLMSQEYTNYPFALHIPPAGDLDPGQVLLSGGTGFNPMQQPTSAGALLGSLQFQAVLEGTTRVVFDQSDPDLVSRITDDQGEPIAGRMVDSELIVIDGTPPVITAPAAVTVNTDAGVCYATNVALGNPVASDALAGIGSIVNDAPAQFGIGITEVTWTATDKAGNVSTATQTVTVVDNENPTITAPGDILANTDPGKGYATIANIGTPVASDNCAYSVSNDNPVTDTHYPVGVTTITWTVRDASNNTATAVQTITVVDAEAPTVTKGIIDACYPSVEAAEAAAIAATTVNDNSGLDGVTVTAKTLGTSRATIKVTATDASSNSSYVTYYTRIDGEKPVITCPASITVNADAGLTTAVVDPGTATATDNCDGVYLDGFEAANWEPNFTWIDYNATVTKVASDPEGLAAKSGDYYGKITPPAVGDTGAYTRLGGYSNSFGTGYKTSLDIYIDPSAVGAGYGWDLCCASSRQNGEHLRDFFFHAAAYAAGKVYIAASNNGNSAPRQDLAGQTPHGEITAAGWYTFQWTFRNNGGALAVDLVVLDSDGDQIFSKTLSNAADLIASVVGGNRYMWFTFIKASSLAIDNTKLEPTPLETPTIEGVRSDGAAMNAPYPIGTTTITWTATDKCGNDASCAQTIKVNDFNTVNVEVELENVVTSTITRDIEFTFGGDGTGTNTFTKLQSVTFSNKVGTATINVPATASGQAINWTCVTAKDRQHTLMSNVNLTKSGVVYGASFTGAENCLLGGDLTNDNLVDILDFGVFAGQYGTKYIGAQPWPKRDADISGDGAVTSAEFTFIQSHFLKKGDKPCSGAAVQSVPRASISVFELADLIGVRYAGVADLNRDNKVDIRDIQLFLKQYMSGR